MTDPIANFNEEHSAKIPALSLLARLGYQFISPSDSMAMCGNRSTVILPNVLRSVLAQKTFPSMGQECPLSDSSIDKIVHGLANTAMNEGLKAANAKLYDALTHGVGVTQFVDGKKVSPTILISL